MSASAKTSPLNNSSLLGMAFAAADLLLEVDKTGRVRTAIGAGAVPTAPATEWVGGAVTDRLRRSSRHPVAQALCELKPGARSASLQVLLDGSGNTVRRATLRLFMLPELAPAASCAIIFDGAAFELPRPAPPILETDAFLTRAKGILEAQPPQSVSMAFVDVNGLSASGGGTAAERIETVLQGASLEGEAATHVKGDRYALLRAADDKRDLAAEIRTIGEANGLDLDVRSAQAKAEGNPRAVLRAIRHAIEACLKSNPVEPETAFTRALQKTVSEADAFRVMVSARQFALHYQPIVALHDRRTHHYEALARFNGKSSPEAVIRMAEDLDLMQDFDLAVMEKAVQRLRRPGSSWLTVAINASGASITGDGFVDAALTLGRSGLRPGQLIIEVTETTALSDLAVASRKLAALRAAGIQVYIDDFGSGAASYDYLRGLPVDGVKIDGRFIRGLEKSPRDQALVRHLAELSRSLGMTTVAEMVETEAAADRLRQAGVEYGQGWLFGRPQTEPLPDAPVRIARRAGATESWG